MASRFRIFDSEQIAGYIAVMYLIMVSCLQIFILTVGIVEWLQYLGKLK